MGAIDIGAPAIDRDDWTTFGYTVILVENPANATGTITSVEIWAMADYDLVNCEVATFEEVDTDTFTTRDNETIGSVTSGSKQTFSGLDMDVETGDYIGYYFTDGRLEYSVFGDGCWYETGDYIPCSEQLFNTLADRSYSLYGTGATPAIQAKTAHMAAKMMGARAI